jgi:simple sugar transport system substrate-binding protein
VLTAAVCGGGSGGATADFKFGMILVGAQNDHGWSQAHYEAGRYVVEQLHLPSDALMIEDR